ncbi:MAG TPA: FtsX-like permease family protein [Nitrospira sp.]|nr:FtsX-like permease family protein [Nitrospira sp.]
MTASFVIVRTLIGAHAFQQPFRTALTVMGVALGVLASVAITAANVEVLRGFEQAVLTVAGSAALEVSAHDLGLDEHIIEDIRRTPGVMTASPLIEEAIVLPTGPHVQESVQVYGVDLLAEADQLGFRIERNASEEALNELVKGDSLYVGRQLSAELNLERGRTLEARVGSRLIRLRVAGVIEGTDRPGSYWDRVMIMDVAAAQRVFDMIGRLDRIEIVTAPERTTDDVAIALRAVLPASVVIQRPAQRTVQVENMVGAFQLNLAVLSWVGLLVGMFLVYNTMSFAVAQRRREIGIYRALGMTERRVAALFLVEAGVFGSVGGALGAFCGLWLARTLVMLVSRTISDLYVPLTANGSFSTFDAQSLSFVAQGVLVGVVVSMAGAIGPSVDASRTVATKALAPGDYEEAQTIRSGRYVRWSLVLMVAGILCALGPPIRGLPILGYAATLCLLGAFACLSPVCIAALRWSIQRTAQTPALSGNLKRMAADHAARHPGRNAVTVSALLVGLAIMIGVVVMVRSFRQTVEAWVNQTVMADLILAPPSWLHGKQVGHASRSLPGAWVSALEAIEGVAAVDTYRDVQVEVDGHTAALVSRDLRLHADRGRYLMVDGDWGSVLRRAAQRDGVVVSEVLANRLGLQQGGTITITTPAGPKTVVVEGVFYDYATDGGKVVMERTLYRRLWNDDRVTVFALYLSPGVDEARVRRLIGQALAGQDSSMAPPLVINNGELRREILNIFDRTFVLTYVLEAIAVFVAVLGIVNTLVTAVLERRREVATLRAIGASRRQVERLIQWEAVYLGAIGALLGVVGGLVLAWVLIAVINKQSFGWTIRMMVPLGLVSQAAVLAIGAAWIAGYLPARWAARQPVGESLREE